MDRTSSMNASIALGANHRQVVVSVHEDRILGGPSYNTSMRSGDNEDHATSTLTTPIPAHELAGALLGASSTTSLTSATGSLFRLRPRRVSGVIDEDDLSLPYNHYKCLSPQGNTGKIKSQLYINHL